MSNDNCTSADVEVSKFAAMDKGLQSLSADELKVACKILEDRYKSCVQRTVFGEVATSLNVEALEKNCGYLYANLSAEQCAQLFRKGEMVRK